MGSSKGGSANDSGMYAAMASAQAAQQAYTLGNEQLQWTKQVWNQEQPLINQVMSTSAATQQAQSQFATEQEQLYKSTYQPLEQQYAQQASQWASPGQQAINAGAAQTNVATASEAQRNTATEQLESYGINPGSTRFAGLDIGSRTQQAAAEAGAGTQAIQATKLQGLGLEAGAINTGRGVANTTSTLSGTGTAAGSAAAGVGQSNLATGSSAMTAPTNWYNTGASNMNTYVNAVNGYNQAQLGYAQVGAMQGMGYGSALGGILGSMGGSGGLLGMLDAGGPAIPPPAMNNSGSNVGTPGPTPGHAIPPGSTPGGAIPVHASASGGAQVDDVPARLTVGEFVIPKDVVEWEGQKYFYNQIDKTRQAKEQASQRTDIGGQQGSAIPAAPTFNSRPSTGSGQAPAQNHARGMQGGGPATTYGAEGAIPPQRLQQRRAIG